MSTFSDGYKTRYSIGFASTLNQTGFVCASLANFLSKEFGPGKNYFYINDFHPSKYVEECSEAINYFFPTSHFVKRSENIELYRKESVELIKSGWAFPNKYSYSTKPDPSCDSIEKMLELVNSRKDISIKLNKSNNSYVVIIDLIRGPIKFEFTADKSQIELINSNGMPTPMLCNVVDDIRLDVGIVIRELFDQERSAQETFIHYFMGHTPPYYIHLDFSKEFKTDCMDYANKKLPPDVMINAVLEKIIDKNKINYGDLRFISNKVPDFSIDSLKTKIALSLKNSTKEERDNILKASFPNSDNTKISWCSDVARQMSACELDLKNILTICKAICKTNVEYNDQYAPLANSAEFCNLESYLFRMKSYDFSNEELSLEVMTSRFCEQASMHVTKFDAVLEYCLIGNTDHLNKNNRRAWWTSVAQAVGKEETCKRIEGVIKKIKELCW